MAAARSPSSSGTYRNAALPGVPDDPVRALDAGDTLTAAGAFVRVTRSVHSRQRVVAQRDVRLVEGHVADPTGLVGPVLEEIGGHQESRVHIVWPRLEPGEPADVEFVVLDIAVDRCRIQI